MLMKAIEFALRKHEGQVRKGTSIPYITHPFEVMNILLSNGYDIDVCVAGLLHDTLEDTDTTDQEIIDLFGKRVHDLVLSHTEDKTRSWEERKETTVTNLSNTSDLEEAALCFADSLANLRSLSRDYETVGEALWKRFKRGANEQLDYYFKILTSGSRLVDKPMYGEYVRLYESFSETIARKRTAAL
jgi:(p)ppGpp synthase/HD superfamily hydrolase